MALPKIAPRRAQGPTGIADADLVLRAREGDTWASAALYRRHVRPLISLVARLLASTQDVEDIVHDVFVESLRKLDGLRQPSAYRSWLRQIALARVRSVLRRRTIARRLGIFQPCEDATLEALGASTMGPDELTELRRIDETLRVVSAEERLVWTLHHVEGETTQVIAELTGRSTATVKRRLAAAQDKIARHVKERS